MPVAGRLGISNDATVVVYNMPSQGMGMVAWTFLYYGQTYIRILDGGITKWLAESRPATRPASVHPHGPAISYALRTLTGPSQPRTRASTTHGLAVGCMHLKPPWRDNEGVVWQQD